jgi:hypothetical protein
MILVFVNSINAEEYDGKRIDWNRYFGVFFRIL